MSALAGVTAEINSLSANIVPTTVRKIARLWVNGESAARTMLKLGMPNVTGLPPSY